MPVPTQENIQQSFAKLQEGAPLFRQDFFNIAREFVFSPDQDVLLMQIHQHNQKLAEALLIFRHLLQEAAAGAELEAVIDHLLLHYIINTDAPIPELEEEDPFDVFDAVRRYAQTLFVAVNKGPEGESVLHLNGKQEVCPEWTIVLGCSAAWSLRQAGPVINRARYGRNDVIPSVAFGFDEAPAGYRLQNAMMLADFSHLAYFEPDYVEKHLRQWGYTAFRWIEDADTDTQAFVAGKGQHLVVCFRGTSSGKDALADLNFFKTAAFGGRGRVHQGFQQSLDGVWTQVQAAVDALGTDKKIFVCGHSLGAAIAQLAAHRLALNTYPLSGVYVYGSPRTGNQEFREAYNELLEANTFLHINHEDIVTQVPPQLFGFQHVGGAPRKFNEAHSISRPDAPQADDGSQLRFEDLKVEDQEALQQQMQEVQRSIAAATRFLRTSPQQFSGASYGTTFESGGIDDHSMDQYLFKFACALVEGEWKRVAQKKSADKNA